MIAGFMRMLNSLGLYTYTEFMEGLSDAKSSIFDFQFKYYSPLNIKKACSWYAE